MTMKEFINNNKDELDRVIIQAVGNPYRRMNNEERRLWILNDEGLYNWAKSEGVRV